VQITHFCNSCLSVRAGKTSLMCDPWIGPADTNAWLSYPFLDEGKDIIARLNPDFIYISHLHPDHHDPKTLEHVAKDTTIIIKAFPDHRLFHKLQAQDFSNIIELDAWSPLTLGDDLEIAIVPATSMVNQAIEGAIHYDIDTSLLVRCLKSNQVFYNNVDNPTGLPALNSVREFSEKTWGRPIDIACLPVGAASEYPHCFVNIDRKAAARRIIDNSLADLPARIEALGCHTFFAAGGTYVIRGKFAALNQYIGQPNFRELDEFLTAKQAAGLTLYSLEGGRGVVLDPVKAAWLPCETSFEKTSDKTAYALASKPLDYDYSTACRDGALSPDAAAKRMRAALRGALANHATIMNRIGLVQDWITELYLYQNLILDDEGNIAAELQPIDTITLPCKKLPSRQTLSFHMDIDLFTDLIEGRGNWNGALSGTYIIYERAPDIFIPDAPFSLNFLVDRSHSYN